MKWSDVFPTYDSFNTFITTVVLPIYTKTEGGNQVIIAEWLDSEKMFSTFEIMYFHLNNYWKTFDIRYDSEIFLQLFANRFSDSAFDLYFKQQAFINRDLDEIKDISKRDDEDKTTYSGSDKTDGYDAPTTVAQKATPIDNTTDVANKGQTNKTFGKIKTTDRYNIIRDLKKLMNYRYRIGIDEFVESFAPLFRLFYAGKVQQNIVL